METQEERVDTPELNLSKNISLPITKIKMIMKSSPEVASISQESVQLIARATEMFIQHLALLALRNSNDAYSVEYQDLAEVINGRNTMGFLHDIIPRKIKAKDYLEMMEDDDESDECDYDDDDDDDEDDEEEEITSDL
uniref:Chromatin accessibility complex protein 1 n=1 Tax=Strigamia maritima TaxID=126957 RepID=T1JB53_STRMM